MKTESKRRSNNETIKHFLISLLGLALLCGCIDSQARKEKDGSPLDEDQSFAQIKSEIRSLDPFDELNRKTFKAIEDSTEESVKRPTLIFANLDRSVETRPVLQVEWVCNSIFADEVCVTMSNGKQFCFDCTEMQDTGDYALFLAYTRETQALGKALSDQRMPGAVAVLRKDGEACSNEVLVVEVPRMKLREKRVRDYLEEEKLKDTCE